MELRELTADDRALVEAARQIADTHADGLIHTVGAAVRDAEGKVHGGINLFHFNGGPCAELVAIATARTNGARRLTMIVAVGHHHRGVLPPCGRDRQVLFDYHPDIRVILPTPEGLRSVPIDGLLPLSYRWSPIEPGGSPGSAP